jgi:hypothetical protein
VPFVQGQLRGKPLTVFIETECAHCHQPMHLEIDSTLQYHVVEQNAAPLVFAPLVDLDKLSEPSIIHAF